jgi:hypothetical protein
MLIPWISMTQWVGPGGALMSTNLKHVAIASLKPLATVEPFNRRRVDRVDEPARPLGGKRAALQARRMNPSARFRRPKGGQPASGAVNLASNDQRVSFTLRGTALGLVIERSQRQIVGTRLVQIMVFTDSCAFDRWCEFEPVRFKDALLYSQLRREGYAALTAKK